MNRLEKRHRKAKLHYRVTTYLGHGLIRDPVIFLYFLVVLMGGFLTTSVATIIYYSLKYMKWI